MSGIPAFDRIPGESADVCLIVEGCYPHVAGGVSTWIDWLIRSIPETRFGAVSLVTPGEGRTARYKFGPNLVRFQEIVMGDAPPAAARWRARRYPAPERLATLLVEFVRRGELATLAAILRLVNDERQPIPLAVLDRGDHAFAVCREAYRQIMPHGSFKDFFWAWQALMGGLFAVLKAPLPAARTYHTISTGYAGLFAARAAIEGAERVLITEHGIYTNERRIEILMADWMVDTVDQGLAIAGRRTDLRDLWIMAFESYARCCYAACDGITTLFGENQPMQRALGAAEARLVVIPNGIELDRFGTIPPAPPEAPPTAALVGRVVPIKDIKTYIEAAAHVRRAVPDAQVLVAGPEDEDPAYAAECRELVQRLGLGDTVKFLGRVDVRQLLASTHVVVLTSLSEAQPLTVLEAGAAGRPCVTTDVGACREMIEGSPDEDPESERGGYVTNILAADEIGEAVARLLTDAGLRERLGANLRRRVHRDYASQQSADRYRRLYDGTLVPKAA
ncbi:pellicle/biofilm biosynthesis glycosyltransferase PelF [Aureimonas endophytica]|uniref:Pellicle/biofilm biosynthesis glycosyltransferase PelF n=1 Tax=Aureimonas endophytica TaxID=2027858 RepID=A0A917E0S4_9HYPH|nr:GT4 family glycosyltransferase PelF [Aureimonas endophytica]GGD90342.1 pellicle/biofilm biosynthesis glycosyltransferase PelF [Aureimonas endophytica]